MILQSVCASGSQEELYLGKHVFIWTMDILSSLLSVL